MGPEEVARTYYRLFNERRFDEAEQLIDAHTCFHYVPTKQHLIGRAGYRALVAAWLIGVEDAQVEILTVREAAPDVVRVEFIGRGTHTGDLVFGEALTLPASGCAAGLPFTDTLLIRGGRILDSRLDFDVEELRRRLMGVGA
jgi:hypothetical protein